MGDGADDVPKAGYIRTSIEFAGLETLFIKNRAEQVGLIHEAFIWVIRWIADDSGEAA